jgi:hypothetical protein
MADKQIIAIACPVTITAAPAIEGVVKGPPKFDVVAYTGGALQVGGWDLPVVIDLEGLKVSRNVVANLDHEGRQRVGHVTEHAKTESELKLSGVFSAATPFRAEVVDSAASGFQWEASVEVMPDEVEEPSTGRSSPARSMSPVLEHFPGSALYPTGPTQTHK